MELASGKYVFNGSRNGLRLGGFTVGKVYEFKDGYVIDNDGDRRPMCIAKRDALITWFENYSPLWTKVEDPKLVNGWYKCTERGNIGFTHGKQYYFKDGFTVDDGNRCRPLSGCDPQKYDDTSSERWFHNCGLVPANSISDAIERVAKMAVVCSSDHGDCKADGCPYANFGPNGSDDCHDFVKKDCEMIGQPHEAFKNVKDELAWPTPGCTIRQKSDLIVYVVKTISRKLRHPNIANIELLSTVNNYARIESNITVDQFWEVYEAFEPTKDGWNGSVVSTCDYIDAYANTVMKRGAIYDVVNGIVNVHSPMFIKNPSEFMKKGNIPMVFEVKGTCAHSPSRRFDYTGRALCKDIGEYPGFKMGYIYDFILGETANDFGETVRISRETFRKYFVPLD